MCIFNSYYTTIVLWVLVTIIPKLSYSFKANLVMNDCKPQAYTIECLIVPSHASIYNSTLLKDMYCCTKFWLSKYRIHSDFSIDQIIYSSELLSSIFDHLSSEETSSTIISSRTNNRNRIAIKYEHRQAPTIRYLKESSTLLKKNDNFHTTTTTTTTNSNNNNDNEKNRIRLDHQHLHRSIVLIMNSTSLFHYLQYDNNNINNNEMIINHRLNQSTIHLFNHMIQPQHNPSIIQYFIHSSIVNNNNHHLSDIIYKKLLSTTTTVSKKIKNRSSIHYPHSEITTLKINILPYGVRKTFISKLLSYIFNNTTSNHEQSNDIMNIISKQKSILLTCFYITSNSNNYAQHPCLKYHNNMKDVECISCIRIDNNIYNPVLSTQYYDILIQSKFVIVLSNNEDGCYDLTNSRSAWIFEAILLHTIPILWNTNCISDEDTNNLFRLHVHKAKLPMIKITDILDHNNISIDVENIDFTILIISFTRLDLIYEEMTVYNPQLYTFAPLFFSSWLTYLLPSSYITSHISRGISKHIQFVGEQYRYHIPPTSRNSSSYNNSIMMKYNMNINQNSYIYRILKHIHEPISFNNIKNNKICKEMKSSRINTKNSMISKQLITSSRSSSILTSNNTTKYDRKNRNPLLLPPYIEIVIPRCCETMDGDLVWANQLLSSFNHINFTNNNNHNNYNRIPYIVISIYYKCPWCIPQSKSKYWIQYLLNNTITNNSNNNIKEENEVFSKLSPKDLSRISLLIKMYGHNGIQILDNFQNVVNTKYLLKEIPAFDLYSNGKEATAYLNHIVKRYDTLAFHTMFLHTQPAHHLEFERFVRIFEYLHQCYNSILSPLFLRSQSSQSSSYIVRYNNNNNTTTANNNYKNNNDIKLLKEIEKHAIDFMSLNYRWMNGIWAHQPEMCMMDVLEYLFQNSTQFGDQSRSSSKKVSAIIYKDIKQFHAIPMASGVAAQFITSKTSIQMRSLYWWNKVYELNQGLKYLTHCQNPSFTSDFRRGSEIASVMERIWHNLFRNCEINNENALYYPDIKDHYWLSSYLTTTTINNNNNINKNNNNNNNNNNNDRIKNSLLSTRENHNQHIFNNIKSYNREHLKKSQKPH